MTTFREVYNKGMYPYMLALFVQNGGINSCGFAHDLNEYGNEILNSESFCYTIRELPDLYEIYATMNGLSERLGEIIREKIEMPNETFDYTLGAVRLSLKTIYKTKK